MPSYESKRGREGETWEEGKGLRHSRMQEEASPRMNLTTHICTLTFKITQGVREKRVANEVNEVCRTRMTSHHRQRRDFFLLSNAATKPSFFLGLFAVQRSSILEFLVSKNSSGKVRVLLTRFLFIQVAFTQMNGIPSTSTLKLFLLLL